MSAAPHDPLTVALTWAARGFPAFPVGIHPEADDPGKLTKRPLTARGHKDGSTDPAEVRRLFADRSRMGPGEVLAAGMCPGPAGYVVLDPDRHGHDGPALADLLGIPPTWTTDTATDGEHRYLNKPEGMTISNAAPDGWGGFIDVRSDGGWVVCPGTVTPWGEWKARRRWNPDEVADLPSHVADMLKRAGKRARGAAEAPVAPRVDSGGPVPIEGSGGRFVTVPRGSIPWASRGLPYWEKFLAGHASDLATTGEGSRNNALYRTAYALGGLAAAMAEPDRDLRAEAEQELMTACDRNGLGPDLSTFDSGWDGGEAEPWFVHERPMSEPAWVPEVTGSEPIARANYGNPKDTVPGLREAFDKYRNAGEPDRTAALFALIREARSASQTIEVAAAMAKQGHFLPDLSAGMGQTPDGLIRLAWEAAPAGNNVDGVPAIERYPVLDWHELFARDADIHWLAEPVIEVGRIVCIYSPAKAGKSLLSLEVAAALATGTAVLGQPGGRPVRVLYVDCENSLDDIRERLEDLGYGPEDLDGLRYLSFPSLPALNSPEGGADLVALADAHGAALVIIDTTSRVVDGAEKDPEGIQGLYRNALMHLKRQGIAVLRLDHAGKDASKGQRGTSAKNDDADSVWLLKKNSEDSVTLVRERTRQNRPVDRVEMRRGGSPLRHTVSGEAGTPHGVLDLVAEMDRLGVPRDAGRDRARKSLTAAGLSATNAVLSQAIAHRRARTAEAQPVRGQVTEAHRLSDRPDLSAAHPDRSPDSCSPPVHGQVADRSDRWPEAQSPDLSGDLSVYRTDRSDGRESLPVGTKPHRAEMGRDEELHGNRAATLLVSLGPCSGCGLQAETDGCSECSRKAAKDGTKACGHPVGAHGCGGPACQLCMVWHGNRDMPWPCLG